MKRRGLFEALSALAIGTVAVGAGMPVAINKFGKESATVLSIAAGDTYELKAGDTEVYTAVDWEGSGAQLDYNTDGTQLEVVA